MCDLVLTQTTVSDGHRALASPSLLNSPAPVGRAVGCMVAGAGFGSEACTGAGAGAGAATGAGAGAATGAGAGAAIGAVDAVWPLRQDFRNCCQVWPLVVPFALAAFAVCHWSPHCFITLWASAAPVVARPRAAATRNAENAAFKEFFMFTPLRASLCSAFRASFLSCR